MLSCPLSREVLVSPSTPESHARLAVRGALRVLVTVALCALGARAGWVHLWVFLGLALLTVGVNLFVLVTRNPELLWQRLKPDRPEEGYDRLFIRASGVLFVAMFIVAGLDVLRYQWSALPLSASVLGAALWLIGAAPIAWAMAENPYLERTVRHQTERGHHVVTTGPYAWVRHPMYAGLLIVIAGLPLVLGSLWAGVPAILSMALFVARTYLEDRTLQRKLPGYQQYTRQTRYRLAPGLW